MTLRVDPSATGERVTDIIEASCDGPLMIWSMRRNVGRHYGERPNAS